MICRHHPGDPACGSTGGGWKAAENAREAERSIRDSEQRKTKAALDRVAVLERQLAAMSPDASAFDIEDIKIINNIAIVKVRFPNCSMCVYEDNKVLVYENVSALDIARWRKLDPHFREAGTTTDPKVAPPPVARFPASDEGWRRAWGFAQSISTEGSL